PMTLSTSDVPISHVPAARIFRALWFFITLWLLACAFLVTGEYADGYQTIVNARYLFGDAPIYYVNRGPLAAIVLWPIEVLVDWFDVGPFQVTPYHLYSAVLHSVYLLGCWWALSKVGDSLLARLIAIATAVTTVAFYCYAPYLSHDILPGLLFLLMIFIAHRWLSNQSGRDAALLVIIGAVVVLIKQTYALFWFSIVAYGVIALLFRWDDRIDWRKLALLLSLAALSAGLTWVGYAWFAGGQWQEVPWYLRPWELAVAVSDTFGDNAELVFPADLYLRNLHNFGVLAMLLLIPGLVFALRGMDSRLRMVAVCWLLSAIVMQFLTFKEVRYMLFLAPLTAVLIVPAIHRAMNRRLFLLAILFLVIVDQGRGLTMAARQLSTAAAVDPVRFFESAGTEGRIVASKTIAFVYHATSPLRRDTYHGIYHAGARLQFALQEGKVEVQSVADTRELGMARIEPGNRVYLANVEIRRFSPYLPDNTPGMLPEYIAVAGRAATFRMLRRGDDYVVDGLENASVMLIPKPEAGQIAPLLSDSAFNADQLQKLYGDIRNQDSFAVTGIIIDAICQANTCQYR
ncbi:MAG: hypothetical protein KJO82_09220, partial [Gammaproteobacteria bacterium]|nr:hypothetical protein [Gammaproteobacteria bacterium]